MLLYFGVFYYLISLICSHLYFNCHSLPMIVCSQTTIRRPSLHIASESSRSALNRCLDDMLVYALSRGPDGIRELIPISILTLNWMPLPCLFLALIPVCQTLYPYITGLRFVSLYLHTASYDTFLPPHPASSAINCLGPTLNIVCSSMPFQDFSITNHSFI